MKRSVWVYALALAASLVWGYGAWTSEETPLDGQAVEILGGKVDDLASVTYTSDSLDVTITMLEDDLGRYGWARVVPHEAAPMAEDPDSPAAKGEPEEFKVGKTADKILEGVAPFVAKRILEGVDEDQLAELGLAPAEATLTIERSGRDPKTYEISTGGFGGVNAYVRDTDDGTIYIVDAKIVSPFKTAARTLPDRALHGVELPDMEAVTVSDGTREVKFVQHNADDRSAAFWSLEGEQLANEAGAAWLDKALNLKVAQYLQGEDVPSNAAEVFAYTLEAAGTDPIVVRVLRGYDDKGEDVFFAKSTHNRAVVKLHRSAAAEAVADLESALTGEAPPPREPAGDAGAAPGGAPPTGAHPPIQIRPHTPPSEAPADPPTEAPAPTDPPHAGGAQELPPTEDAPAP